MGKPTKRVLGGVVAGVGPGLTCQVRLASGEQVPARIPHHTAWLMFRVVSGDRVAVEQQGIGPFVVLGHEQAILDGWCAAHLTRDGRAVADWFLIGECPCFWSRYGDIGDWRTSDDRLYAAVRDYLRRHDAPVYESHAEASKARRTRLCA